jgi:DNA-binding response OmpR family regulator
MYPGAQIALIDDDRAWVETLADYLHSQGFSIQTAFDGVRGLSLLEGGGIAVALVDLNMPGITGLELLRHLRKHGRPVAVLLVSGEDDPTLAARVKAEGGEAFLSKAMSPRLFLATVRRALAKVFGCRPADRLNPLWNRPLPGPRGRRSRAFDPHVN